MKNKENAEKYIKEISEKYRDATHNCFAYTY
ncbi:YigZ family protein [bacterium]|nr:YigZ family protein [bacterium]